MSRHVKLAVCFVAAAVAATTICATASARQIGGGWITEGRERLRDRERENRIELRNEQLARLKEIAPNDIKAIIEKYLAKERLQPEEREALADYARERVDNLKDFLRERLILEAPDNIWALMLKRLKGEELAPPQKNALRTYLQGKLDEVRAEFRQKVRNAIRDRIKEEAPDDIKAIIEKREQRQNLTLEEAEALCDYLHEQLPLLRERVRKEIRDEVTAELKATAPAEIKAIIEKREAGQELTAEEREALRNYVSDRLAEKKSRMLEKLRQHAPDNILTIIEKREKGNKLTPDEKQQLADYIQGLRQRPRREAREE